MSREVLILVRCDRCRTKEEDLLVGDTLLERTVTLDAKPLRLDLCPTCDEAVLGDLRDLLTEHGVAPEPASNPPRRRRSASTPPQAPTPEPDHNACPLCTHPSPTRSALSQHLRHSHDTTLKAEVAAGRIAPLSTGRPPKKEPK